jgi:hypothetical protein
MKGILRIVKQVTEAMQHRFRGGATIFVPGCWPLSLPLMAVEASDDGIRVFPRWRWVAWPARIRVGRSLKEPNWAARWEGIERVAIARYSVLFVQPDGTRCWFWVVWSQRARQIAETVKAHGTPTVRMTGKESRALVLGRRRG